MIARLYIDGNERASMPVPETGITLEMFGVEFAAGTHDVTVTISPDAA